jgi:hypothetical protein
MSNASFWTDYELNTLKQLVSEKLSASVIAERMGRSRNAIIGATHRYSDRVGKLRWWVLAKKRGLKITTIKTVKKRQAQKRPFELGMETKEAKDIIIDVVPPEQLRTLMELETGQCRWPVGDMFCGDHVERGAYCQMHTARSHMYQRK